MLRVASRPVALRGWDSKVTEVTPSEKIPLWALMFRLYGQRVVRPTVRSPAKSTWRERPPSKTGLPTFDSLHLQPGELPHYVAFFPPSFDGAERTDGRYELRWYEKHGLSRRLLAKPHRFTIRNGRVLRARPE
jgi:hypothetical protein